MKLKLQYSQSYGSGPWSIEQYVSTLNILGMFETSPVTCNEIITIFIQGIHVKMINAYQDPLRANIVIDIY